MNLDLTNEVRYRRIVVSLLAVIAIIEAVRGVAEWRRVVLVSGDVDVNNTITVEGAVDARLSNRSLDVHVTNVPLFVTGR